MHENLHVPQGEGPVAGAGIPMRAPQSVGLLVATVFSLEHWDGVRGVFSAPTPSRCAGIKELGAELRLITIIGGEPS